MRGLTNIPVVAGIFLAVLLLATVRCGVDKSPFLQGVAPQNVVVIVIDTLRQDHLECYGYHRQTAPNICRLAAEGATFDGIAPSSWTMPSTASILTGLHPIRHQAHDRNDKLPRRTTTLAEILKEYDYATIAASGNGWVSERFGFQQGFDEFIQVERPGRYNNPTAEEINALLYPKLEDLRAPFFLYVHYVEPHTPYDPPYDWTQTPLDERLSARTPVGVADLTGGAFIQRGPQLMRDVVDLYDGEIRSVDSQIAELWSQLERLGLTTDTLTIITADHGEEFEDHGRVGHGMSLYGEVIRVPFIIHAPQVLPPGLRLGRASLMDIVPTVLHFLGYDDEIENGARFDGSSLIPRLEKVVRDGEDSGGNSSGSSSTQAGYLLHLAMDGSTGLALIDGDQKIVLARNPYRKELFDVGSDPREQENLFYQETMATRFSQLAQQLARSYNGFSQGALRRETLEDAGEQTQALRALGYITPSPETLRPREMAPRVVPADPRPGGLLGWEVPRDFTACVQASSVPLNQQLQQGWGGVSRNRRGRWTEQTATLILRPPANVDPDELELQLEGTNVLRRAVRLSVYLNDDPLVQDEVLASGEWSLLLPVKLTQPADSLAVVRIATETGRSEIVDETKRSTPDGVVVKSVCLVAPGG